MRRFLFFLFILLSGFSTVSYADHLSPFLQFTARMNGDQEVPVVTTDAQGVGVFTLDAKKTTIYFNVSLSNLSGPITGMHIHEGLAGENGGVIFNLTGFLNGNRAKGAVSNITPEVITMLLNGGYYINVHTELNPNGEIRGQIHLETDDRYTALMSGVHEVPEVTTDGRGLGIFHLNHARNSVKFKILFQGLSSEVTGAHIHHAQAGMTGPVIFNLASFMNGNSIEGTWEPGAELDALLAGELYVNIHTMNNPDGEIRGQLSLLPGITFDASLSGDQENPAVTTPGKALGIVTIWPELTELEFYVVYDSLSGPAVAAHFHRGVAGANGGVVINLTDDIAGTGNFISGTEPLTPDIFNTLLTGGFYINIHTQAHQSGEIRGQVYRFAREGYLYELNGGQESPPVTTTGIGAGMVSIDRDQTNAHYMLVVSNMMGNFTASHFHRGVPGVSGGVIHNITSAFNAFGGAYGYWDENSAPPFDASPLFRAHEVYVNVHSDMFPSGEVRGNIIRPGSLFQELPFDPKFTDDLVLSAVLNGANENPPVTTDARALATVYFNTDRTSAKVNIAASGLSGPFTGVHIHEGDVGANGPVMFPLDNEGNRVQMEITDIDDLQLISLMNGGTYVNIHTDANPSGEIRGQLNMEQDITFRTSLTGEQEVPPVTTDAVGLATVHYTRDQLSIEINAQVTGLSGPITGAHLHHGAFGEDGPVVIDLGEFVDGNTLRGNLSISQENLDLLFDGSLYLNIHTDTNPGGEIRGQMTLLPGITFDGWMNGIQEVPFASTAASGFAVVTIFPGISDINLWMVADGISGPFSVAHLHQAPIGTSGGVVHNLSGDINGNTILHLGSLADGILSSLLKGEIYINAHTAAYPGGELRGQLFRRARDGYGFDLCKEQEVATINAPGSSGNAMVSIDRNHSNLNIQVVTDGLTGDLTLSHIHGAPVGTNGGVILDLTSHYTNGSMSLYGADADTSLINRIRSGDTYINVHTAMHPGGELRGQIVKEFLCSIETGIDPLARIISDVQLSPVPVVDYLNVAIEAQTSTSLFFHIQDVSGKTLSSDHFELATGENMVILNTDYLLPGFYVLTISDGKGAQAYKFIK